MTEELKGTTDKKQMVDIEGKQYAVDDLSNDAKRYFNQVVRSNDEIANANMLLERAAVTREAFLERLKKELGDG
jgi:hypothetical protein